MHMHPLTAVSESYFPSTFNSDLVSVRSDTVFKRALCKEYFIFVINSTYFMLLLLAVFVYLAFDAFLVFVYSVYFLITVSLLLCRLHTLY